MTNNIFKRQEALLTHLKLRHMMSFYTQGKFMIKPLGNRVLIKRAEAKASKGGILLPDASKEKPKMGEVLAVGPGKIDEEGKLQPMSVKVGDKVLFSAYAGTEVKNENSTEELLVVAEEEILGILN